MSDLLADCAELIAVPSVSHAERPLADLIQAKLEAIPWLQVDRVGDNVVAKTRSGRDRRLVLAGHLDTVAPNGNAIPKLEGAAVRGLGATDMKGGLAVLLSLARTLEAPALDVTYLFYVCEEVDQRHSGLRQLASARPDALEGDAAVLAEPTGGRVEAGCQGTLRLAITLFGSRAHTARAWMGVNAIHRLEPLLARVASYEGRRPVLDGCEYREALQAVRLEGGVANNVVPDRVRLTLNHRYAPDRSGSEALAHLEELIAPALQPDAGDRVEVEDLAEAAAPRLDHPVLADLVSRSTAAPRAKLGWTDVSFFSARGVPAANYGPGDPSLAHTPDERVSRDELETTHRVLRSLLGQRRR